jgi:endonuclease/exonuclease/phosphatase family metal-dependent hydrolase
VTRRDGTIRIATYNVHGCVGSDGVDDPLRVAAVIREMEVDAVGLQEVDCRSHRRGHDTIDRLAAHTGMVAIAGPTMREHGGFFGNAFLTRHPVVSVSHFDISVAGREPRGLMELVLSIPANDGGEAITVRLLNTHFGLRAGERRRQVDVALVRATSETTPVTLMGDFNEWHPRGLVLARLRAAFGPCRAVRSFPARYPIFALDRIWVRPHGAIRSICAVRHGAASLASDHLPVVAVLDPERLRHHP